MSRLLVWAAALLAPAGLAAGEKVENPVYRSWAGFAEGTSVTYRSVTRSGAGRTEQTMTYTLVELTDERAVVELVVEAETGGAEVENPPQRLVNARWFTLPPGVDPERFGKPRDVLGRGEEAVELAGQAFRTSWYENRARVEAGDMFTKTWTSAEVPGGLVKSVSRTPAAGSTMTIELSGVDRP